MKELIQKFLMRLRGEVDTQTLINRGMQVGVNFHRMAHVLIDPGHCWLIHLGNHVTLAPGVHILAHDASCQHVLGVTKIGMVTIGDYVFVGADTVILPGVTIGNRVIIGANSVIVKDIPSGSVVAGNPAQFLMSYEAYKIRHLTNLSKTTVFDKSYTLSFISKEKKKKMIEILSCLRIGYLK